MPSVFPGAADSLTASFTDASAQASDHAAHHNEMAEAINAVEAEIRLGNLLNVKHYGAYGDNTHNDAAAIQAVIDASAGKVVYFPPGTYLTGTTTLTVPFDNVSMVGSGPFASLVRYTGSGSAIANVDETLKRYFYMSNLGVDTRSAVNGHTAIKLDNVYRPAFWNLRLNGAGKLGTALDLIGSDTKSCYLGLFFNLDITAGSRLVVIRDNANRHRFYGGVWDGAGTAISIIPGVTAAGTNAFHGVAVQTTNAVVVQLGGAGAAATDNVFLSCHMEPTTSDFNIETGSLRNQIVWGSYAGAITFNDDPNNATTMLLPNLGLFQFGNTAAGANGVKISPTGDFVKAIFSKIKTWNPGSIADGARATTTITGTGASMKAVPTVGFDQDLQGLHLWCYMSSASVVTVVLENNTGSPVDLASGELRVTIFQH